MAVCIFFLSVVEYDGEFFFNYCFLLNHFFESSEVMMEDFNAGLLTFRRLITFFFFGLFIF